MAAETPSQDTQSAAPEAQEPTKNLVFTLSDGTKVKRRVPRQRSCNEPASKGKKGEICAGHLKRWYFFGDEVEQKLGPDAEIYRCERCHTLYLPNEQEQPRTLIQSY